MIDPAANEWLELTTTPPDVAAATAFAICPLAGGIDIFLGTTRAEKSTDGHDLLALEYQAYEPMARRQLQNLATGARFQFPILRIVILHRLGRVAVGEASVLIAVSTPHRAESFAACRWIIDELKKDVTIWKREIWASGEPTWVHR